MTSEFPARLQFAVDEVIAAFKSNKKASSQSLGLIQEWLEVDGWDALISDLGDQMALNLCHLAQFQFEDGELRACMDIPKDVSVTDDDRIRWGRGHIDRVLTGDDEYLLPSVHTYELSATDGSKACIACTVEIHGQGGPVCQWQGIWPTRESFLQALGKDHDYWVVPLMGDIPDDVILKLWQKPKARKSRSTKRAKNA